MERALQIRLCGDKYKELTEQLSNSIILQTDESVGLDDILAEIPKDMQWGAGFIAPGKFLLRAPASWRSEALIRGGLHLAGHHFNVTCNVSEVSLHSECRKVWVRLIALPYEMRGEDTIASLVKRFGTFIEVDHNTKHNVDLRWARVYVSVPGHSIIPTFIPLDVLNDEDENFEMNILVEEETPFSPALIDLSNVLDDTFSHLPILRTNSGSGVPDVPPGFEYRDPACPTTALHGTPGSNVSFL